MYKTVKELHIGIDVALQSIDTNRKLVFKSHEKDWVLNEVMYQEILNMTNALKGNRQFEDRILYINALQSLKSKPVDLRIYKTDNDNEVFSVLPANCLTPIASQSVILPKPFKKDIVYNTEAKYDIAYSVVPFLKANNLIDYKTTLIKFGDTDVLFKADATRPFSDNKPLYPLDTFQQNDSRYMLIPLILEKVNRDGSGVELYWEKFLDIYQPDCFIAVVRPDVFDKTLTSSKGTRKFDINTTAITLAINTVSQTCKFTLYNTNVIVGADNQKRVSIPNRIVSDEEVYKISDNVFARSSKESTTSVIDNGFIRINVDETFAVESLRLKYYRKPVLINHVTGTMCEITDDFFLINLVAKTAVKLSARIQDENYPLISHESVLIN